MHSLVLFVYFADSGNAGEVKYLFHTAITVRNESTGETGGGGGVD